MAKVVTFSQIFVWMLLSLCCLGSFAPQVYYIAPEDGSCSVDGKTVSPCYSFQQLIGGNVLLDSVKDGFVKLLLLPGTHMIPANESLEIANFNQVIIAPWKSEEKAVIECDSQGAPLGDEADIAFNDNVEMNMWSLSFTSCSLQFNYNKIEGSVSIENCMFEESVKNYAITFANGESKLNVAVSDCNFSSNYGGIAVRTSFSPPVVVVNSSQFVGNTAEYGAAIFVHSSYLIVDQSQFLNNTARVDGGAILVDSSSSLQVCGVFTNNTAGQNGGAIFISSASSSQLHGSQFGNNTADSNGGAIFANYSSLQIDSCLFQYNEAGYGGAILSYEFSMTIKNATFFRNHATGQCSAICSISITSITGCQFVENSAGTQATVLYCRKSGSILYC